MTEEKLRDLRYSNTWQAILLLLIYLFTTRSRLNSLVLVSVFDSMIKRSYSLSKHLPNNILLLTKCFHIVQSTESGPPTIFILLQ